MLPAGNRLRRRPDFTAAVRHGRRAGRGTVVVHLLVDRAAPSGAVGSAAGPVMCRPAPPRVGLVVGRAVGPAVVRNQVKRRLRHILRARLDSLPDGSLLVVRAVPAAATAGSAVLAADVEAALARVLGPRARPGRRAAEPARSTGEPEVS